MLNSKDHRTLDQYVVAKRFSVLRLKVLVIVASTGGPLAIQYILKNLPTNCPLPVLIIQHMPAHFTQNFAERLDASCQIQVKEAQQGDVLQAGLALVAPGGMQMEVSAGLGGDYVTLRQKTAAEIYAPCADVTLDSIASHFRRASLSLILTGMGVDGKVGAEKLRQQSAWIWAQEETSCTIYGMPKAVVEADLADKVLTLDEMAAEFSKFY